MLLKRLDELSEDELKFEYERAGLEGNSEEALFIIRLTMYLVKLGEDPFSFKFKISEEIEKSQPKDLEVECEHFLHLAKLIVYQLRLLQRLRQ